MLSVIMIMQNFNYWDISRRNTFSKKRSPAPLLIVESIILFPQEKSVQNKLFGVYSENFIGTSFCVRYRQVFCLYRLNQQRIYASSLYFKSSSKQDSAFKEQRVCTGHKSTGRHMQAVIAKRLYVYLETNMLNIGKKDELIKKCY